MKILLNETEVKRAVAHYLALTRGDVYPLSNINIKAKLVEPNTTKTWAAFDMVEIDAGELIEETSTTEIGRKPRNLNGESV